MFPVPYITEDLGRGFASRPDEVSEPLVGQSNVEATPEGHRS
jgi:hypothetical protein